MITRHGIDLELACQVCPDGGRIIREFRADLSSHKLHLARIEAGPVALQSKLSAFTHALHCRGEPDAQLRLLANFCSTISRKAGFRQTGKEAQALSGRQITRERV